jgi:Tfp pilus assembly protein PilF
LILFLLTLAVFLPTVRNDFVNYDDPANLYTNPDITRGLCLAGVSWAFTHPVLGHWAPLTTLSHMLDCSLFGLRPWGHHLSNAVLHAAVAALFFLALERMTGAFWPAIFAALLFAWHPLRVESVAWISERKDVLSAFFFMWALYAYAAFVRQRTIWRYLGLCLVFACGLMSKSMLVTLPCVLLLLDLWPLGRFPGPLPAWKLLAEKIPLLLLSLASSGVQLFAVAGAVQPVSLPARIANAVVCYPLYLKQFFWPLSLAVMYPHPSAWPGWEIVLAGAVLVAISTAAVVWQRAAPNLFTGWFWFVGMLAPVIGLVQIGAQSMADRYSYLPSAGLAVIVSWSAWNGSAWVTRSRKTLAPLAMATLVLCLFLTERQICFWKSSEVLFRHAIAVTDKNFIARLNLGVALADQGRVDEAIEQWRAGLAIAPNDPLIHLNLGRGLAAKGLTEEAITHYRASLQARPNSPETRRFLAELLAKEGRFDEAANALRQELAVAPGDVGGRMLLASLLRRQGRVAEAITEYETVLNSAPENFDAHNNLGIAFYQQGRFDDAVQQFRAALRRQPNRPEAHMNLASALASQGGIDDAMAECREVLRLQPGSQLARQKLAALMLQSAKPGNGNE